MPVVPDERFESEIAERSVGRIATKWENYLCASREQKIERIKRWTSDSRRQNAAGTTGSFEWSHQDLAARMYQTGSGWKKNAADLTRTQMWVSVSFLFTWCHVWIIIKGCEGSDTLAADLLTAKVSFHTSFRRSGFIIYFSSTAKSQSHFFKVCNALLGFNILTLPSYKYQNYYKYCVSTSFAAVKLFVETAGFVVVVFRVHRLTLTVGLVLKLFASLTWLHTLLSEWGCK